MYKIYPLSFIIQNVRMSRLRESGMQTHRGDWAVFLRNLSAILLRSVYIEIFSGLYNFPDAQAILVVTPSTNTLHVDMPPRSMPSMKFARHFCWSSPSLLEHQCPVDFRKQVYFLLFFCFQRPTLQVCHPRNLRCISEAGGICVLFVLDNRYISCYATDAIYAACRR